MAQVEARYRGLLHGVPGVRMLDRATNTRTSRFLSAPTTATATACIQAMRDEGVFHPLISDFPMYRGVPSRPTRRC